MFSSLVYHQLRQRIPFFIGVLYLVFRKTRVYKIKVLSQFLVMLILSLTGFLLYGWIFKIPIVEVIGFRWSYFAAFEWSLFLVGSYLYSQHRGHAPIFTITFMAQAASAGGWLYELPYFLNTGEGRIGSLSYILFLNFQIVSTMLLPLLLYDVKIKINKQIVVTVLIYIGFAFFNYLNPTFFSHYGWLQRIPALIMLFTLISGVPRARH